MALSEAQKTIAEDTHRFKVVVAGRRFGKTFLSIRTLAEWAREPNREVWYCAPTYRQAKMIAWKMLKKKMIELNWVSKINESELTITLKNNSVISLKGADGDATNLRGVGLDGIILDEFADIDPEAWFETLRPTLSDKGGKAMFIGTPKGIGNWAYELYQNEHEDSTNWRSFSYTSIDGGRIPPSEIEQARRDLDERTFRQEYEATFETFSGRIYYAFDRVNNVRETDLATDVLWVGIDFNISPIVAVIAVRKDDDIFVIDEISMMSSNTEELAEELKARYPRSKIFAFPDPSGRARKTVGGGRTDFTILQNAGLIVKAPRSHTPVRDRINSVNSRLCGSDGSRHLFISAGCKRMIECLERQTYKGNSHTPDKDSGWDHMNDALGYMVDYLYPIKRDYQPDPLAPTHWGHRTGVTQ